MPPAQARRELRDREEKEKARQKQAKQLMQELTERKSLLEVGMAHFENALLYANFVIKTTRDMVTCAVEFQSVVQETHRQALPATLLPGFEAGIQLGTLLKQV